MADLEARLREVVRGEVQFDVTARALVTMDASNYRRVPLGVVALMLIPRWYRRRYQEISISSAIFKKSLVISSGST